ncbi:DUF5946 family protein [Dehalogenimonas etheniformans]|uniref:Serine/threonine protein kinase n=1 Tax=Dehalogenimonas etheniformans TaxID=1536648 RepID=A0A2P5P5S5_9CHLR|nr:DUF5946 family protein [Dehalogenimonas etheniformans]PPD57652.1 serine/threonine protein kinase [Dehalogenimonas etheniformans]QNT75994.1 serine/threonine protein kinase [Dehalogenimonas etheniformans]
MPAEKTICPGCGLELESTETGLDDRFNASCACRRLYDELSCFTLNQADAEFTHQLIVDAYCAQHAGPKVKTISIAFSLIGLYLVFERDYTGRQVQLAHMALAKQSKQWHRFNPPPMTGTLTVSNVLNSINGENYRKNIHDWAGSVWTAWASTHTQVAELAKRYLKLD